MDTQPTEVGRVCLSTASFANVRDACLSALRAGGAISGTVSGSQTRDGFGIFLDPCPVTRAAMVLSRTVLDLRTFCQQNYWAVLWSTQPGAPSDWNLYQIHVAPTAPNALATTLCAKLSGIDVCRSSSGTTARWADLIQPSTNYAPAVSVALDWLRARR